MPTSPGALPAPTPPITSPCPHPLEVPLDLVFASPGFSSPPSPLSSLVLPSVVVRDVEMKIADGAPQAHLCSINAVGDLLVNPQATFGVVFGVPLVNPQAPPSPIEAPPCPIKAPNGTGSANEDTPPQDHLAPKVSSSTPSSVFSWADRAKGAARYPEIAAEIKVSEDGIPRVRVPNAVFERGAKIHSDYIVGIFYGRAPSYGKIWGVLNYLWGKDRKVTIQNLTENAFLFHIPSQSLRQKILQRELWRVGNSPFFVTEWKASFSLNPPSLQWAPIWATVSNVPFDLITDEGLAFIAKPLGTLVAAKPFTKFDSVDIKVIVNLTKPLPQFVELEREDSQILRLAITFPWLPPLCPLCKEIGHKENLCPTNPAKEKPNPNKEESQKTKSNKPSYNVSSNKNGTWVPVNAKSVHLKDPAPANGDGSTFTNLNGTHQKNSVPSLAPTPVDAPTQVFSKGPSDIGDVRMGETDQTLSSPSRASSSPQVVTSLHMNLLALPTSNAFDVLQGAEDSSEVASEDMVIDPGALSLIKSTSPKISQPTFSFSSTSSISSKDKKKKRKFGQSSPGEGNTRTPLILGASSN